MEIYVLSILVFIMFLVTFIIAIARKEQDNITYTKKEKNRIKLAGGKI